MRILIFFLKRKCQPTTEAIIEESLSLEDKEIEMIRKALDKHHGKRKHAAQELGISERTLYRKIKEYNIDA
jgi:transcriptional regulator with PAS, ATPase and Fis domain